MRATIVLTLALTSVAAAAPARADDAEAQRLLREAYDHWKDETPERCVELTEQALAAEPTTSFVRAQVLLFLGSVHQVKTGKLEASLACYDEVTTLLAEDGSEPARRLLAQALVRKANIVYAEQDDHEGALELFRRAQEATPLATTADMASQLCYRVGRGASDRAERARWLELALTLADEAVGTARAGRAGPGGRGDGGGRSAEFQRRWRAALVRFELQRVIVLEALERKDEAAAAWTAIDPADLDENAHYQLAILHAVRGDVPKAADALRQAMQTRPTAATRNQLRKYVRTEPDFAGAVGLDDWRDLVTDE